jgi:ubiquinone/menaquinone biosynthesis C-methylase UbiE
MPLGAMRERQVWSRQAPGRKYEMRSIDLQNERRFENSKVENPDVRKSQSKYYWAIDLSEEKHKRATYEAIKGKKVLEVGCSSGRDAEHYTRYAGEFTGIDISDAAIAQANGKDLPNATFLCTDGHVLPFADETFDCVIVNALLHHLDLGQAFTEIARVLRPNGCLVFKEPLGTNPFFQAYRAITPAARTVDERPFTFADLALMKRHFVVEDVQWYGFLNILSAFTRGAGVRSVLTRVDDVISRTPVRYFFWHFAGIARKRSV